MKQQMQNLQKRLKRTNIEGRKKILLGVYNQLTTSRTGKQARGEYRELLNNEPVKVLELVEYVTRELNNFGLKNQSERLKEQHLSDSESFTYIKLPDGDIEIRVRKEPQKVLEAIAQASYELARPVQMGFLQPFNTQADRIDFSEFVRKDFNGMNMRMDYVNGRQCKTFVNQEGESYILRTDLFEIDRGDVTPVLLKAQSILKGKPEQLPSDSIPNYDSHQNPREDLTLEMETASQRLRSLGRLVQDSDVHLQDFAKLLADYLVNDRLRPEGVVMSVQYLKYDLAKGVYGIGEKRGQPIQSGLVGQPSMVYSLLEMSMRNCWDKIFPNWFAGEINGFYDQVTSSARSQR